MGVKSAQDPVDVEEAPTHLPLGRRRNDPNSPVAWQKRWKVPSACTCCAWSLRKGGSKATRVRLSGPEPEAGQGLRGEKAESGPRQDREEEPGGGKGLGDEAARQRTEEKGTEAGVVRNTPRAEKWDTAGDRHVGVRKHVPR